MSENVGRSKLDTVADVTWFFYGNDGHHDCHHGFDGYSDAISNISEEPPVGNERLQYYYCGSLVDWRGHG